ncbi:MAG TPA: HAMP domain-containing sensor histidine kinase [Thermoanaerobaculia bacterium]|nr:HAMP domain-containing sensor histidine kinase [Thermoanaerobaculia bacterium]
MIGAKRAKFRTIFENSHIYDRASIVIPFFVISIALGVLAYRSYHLSVRMERGLDSLSIQYLAYAAEVTARRADSTVRNTMNGTLEDWHEIERGNPNPDFESLQQWVGDNDWIVSAIFLPDSDPVHAIYFSDPEASRDGVRVTQEFFTPNGTVRYTYDPALLLDYAKRSVRQQPMIEERARPQERLLPSQSQIDLVAASTNGVAETVDGFAVMVALGAPLEQFAVRASIRTDYIASGWENHRTVSVAFAAISFLLLVVGAGFAIRGLTRETEAAKLRAALIANISHELRTPLSMIRLGAETLKRSERLAENERNDLQESILREVIHLNHLVENVLDVARLQKSTRPLAFTPVRPAELVRTLLTTYRSWIENRGFTLEADIDESIEEQMWDRDGVSRALLNLIDNAIKYSSSDPRLHVSLTQREHAVEISVTDHGIGVSGREIQRIFEPYFRATFSDTETRRGAGLGLTLVHQIMRSHGGRVDVDSLPGSGSTFKLSFPRAKRVQGTEPASAWIRREEPRGGIV